MTIAFANRVAMRRLALGRVMPQPAAQVRAKPLAPDLETDPGTEMGSDLGAAVVEGTDGDSDVAATQRCWSKRNIRCL
jgi:hypothetical protein